MDCHLSVYLKPKQSFKEHTKVLDNKLHQLLKKNTQGYSNDTGHYIMIKEKIHREDITLVNICVHNTGAPKYVK